MILKDLKKRAARLAMHYADAEPEPTMFIVVDDASVPEPGDPEQPPMFTDDLIVGYYRGQHRPDLLIPRPPGESLRRMQVRLTKEFPANRLFFAAYAHQTADAWVLQ